MSKPSSVDKRRHRRYPARNVEGRLSLALDVDILNISLSGLAAKTSTPLKIGGTYSLRLRFGTGAAELEGTVRWCRLSGTRRIGPGEVQPVYEAGVAFREILAPKGTELLRYLEENILLDLDRRICGRFMPKEGTTAHVEAEERFVVRQISRSGALILTGTPLRPEMVVPMEIGLNGSLFHTHGRVVHVKTREDEEDSPQYAAGVEFLAESTEEEEKLKAFIHQEFERRAQEDREQSEEA